MTSENVQKLENWEIRYVAIDSEGKYRAPVIRGFVNDQFLKENNILLWFDLEKGVAMTEKEIFSIGEPNEKWLISFLASGYSLEQLEIKGTNH